MNKSDKRYIWGMIKSCEEFLKRDNITRDERIRCEGSLETLILVIGYNEYEKGDGGLIDE